MKLMKNKRIISLILALVIVFSSVGNAMAATFDLYHKLSIENDTKFKDFVRKPSSFRKVFNDVDNYLQKHPDGKYYSFKEIDQEMKNGAPNSSEAIKNLEPYIEIQGGDGLTLIDNALSQNTAEYDENSYTPESWAAYINARNELEAIKNQRFEKESIVNQKIENLVEMKEALELLPTVDLTELIALVEEGEAMDLSPFTPESSGAYLGAIGVGRNILDNPTNVTEEEVANAVEDIKEKKALLETNFAVEVESIMAPPTITEPVSEGNNVIPLPNEVVAVMTDKSHKSVAVMWNGSVTDGVVGIFDIPGTAEGLSTNQRVAVVEAENFVDKSQLVEAIRRGQATSESRYTPSSYRDLKEAVEAGNIVNDNPNATAEEVAAATERIINALANLVEQQETDRIVYVESPSKITVNLNDSVVMPDTVIAVLNSGVSIPKAVLWIPSSIDTTTPGIKTAEGRVEGTNHRATFTVEVLEAAPIVDRSELQVAIQRAADVNRDLYTPTSVAAMEQALSWANRVNELDTATQSTVNKAADDLNAAIDALETKPEVPAITNLKPDVDQNVKAGDTVTISFNAPEGGNAGYRIALPGSSNNNVIPTNMTQSTPGYYEATWTVPTGFNGRGMLVFVNFTDGAGTNAFATAEGKINITQNLVVTYILETTEITEEVARGNKPVETPTESDKDGYKISSWTMEGNTVVPGDVVIHENKTFTANYEKDQEQWAKVTFAVPEEVQFSEGAVKEYEILKSKTMLEQGVVIPEHKTETIPAGQKLVWNMDLSQTISEDTIFTATLERDDDQYRTITVAIGENGGFINEEVKTFEVLNSVSDEEIITKAKTLVKADDFFILDTATLSEDTVTISFAKDPEKWIIVKFVKDGTTLSESEVHTEQTYTAARIELPEITDVPEGKKVVWTPVFNAETEIVKPEDNSEIVYTAILEKDDEQYKTITVEVGENGSLVDEGVTTFEVLKTATDEAIIEQAKELVQADENYEIDTVTLEGNTAIVSFKKDATKWLDITLKAGENIKLKLKGTTQEGDIVLNVVKGTAFSEMLTNESVEIVEVSGYLFDKWDPEVEIIDGNTTEFTATSKKDPNAWVTVSFVAGENGSFEEGEVEDQEVLKGTLWKNIVIPTPKADEGYVFDKWEPEFPQDVTTIIEGPDDETEEVIIEATVTESKTYTAKFRAVDNLAYEVKLLQVDESGNPILNPYGKPVEIKNGELVEGQSFNDTATVTAPELEKFILIGESEKSLTIGLDTSQNVVSFNYQAKPEALEAAKDEMAGQAKAGIEGVQSQHPNISFSFDEESRTVLFNLHNPEGIAMEELMVALGGSGVFDKIANVENMQSVSFGSRKVAFYDENGDRKPADIIKGELLGNVEQIFAAFGLDPENIGNMQFSGQWHGVQATPDVEGQSKEEERVWFNEIYTFKFRVTDRDVLFDGDEKGTFDGEATKTLVKPYKEALRETPEFAANTGYKLDKYSVSYKTFENQEVVEKTEEVLPADLANFAVEHNMVVKPIVFIDETQVSDYTVKYFVDNEEKTDLEESKTVPVAEPEVKTVEDKVPEYYILDEENSTLVSEESPFTVTSENNVINRYYKKDPSKWVNVKFVKDGTTLSESEAHIGQTYTAAGISPPEVTEVPAGQKIVWTPAFDGEAEIVKPADSNEIIYTATFEIDETQVLNYTVEYYVDDEIKEEWTEHKTVPVANPFVTSVEDKIPENYVLDQDYSHVVSEEQPFEVKENNNTIIRKYEKDPTKWVTVIFSYSDAYYYEKTVLVGQTYREAGVTEPLDQEDEYDGYRTFWDPTFDPDAQVEIIDGNNTFAFTLESEKIPEQWVNVTFELPEDVEFETWATTTYEVYVGKTLDEQGVVVPEHKAETIPVGKKLVWNVDLSQNISEDTTFTATLEKDEEQYTTITIAAGENGSLVDGTDNTIEVLKPAKWADIKAEAIAKVVADENYVFDGFKVGETAVQDTDTVVVDGTYTASFKVDPSKLVTITYIINDGVSKFKENNSQFLIKQVIKGTPWAEVIKPEVISGKVGFKVVDWVQAFYNTAVPEIITQDELMIEPKMGADYTQVINYTMEYYKDSLNGELLGTSAKTIWIGDPKISGIADEEFKPEGYVFGGSNPELPITITEGQLLKVYYEVANKMSQDKIDQIDSSFTSLMNRTVTAVQKQGTFKPTYVQGKYELAINPEHYGKSGFGLGGAGLKTALVNFMTAHDVGKGQVGQYLKSVKVTTIAEPPNTKSFTEADLIEINRASSPFVAITAVEPFLLPGESAWSITLGDLVDRESILEFTYIDAEGKTYIKTETIKFTDNW